MSKINIFLNIVFTLLYISLQQHYNYQIYIIGEEILWPISGLSFCQARLHNSEPHVNITQHPLLFYCPCSWRQDISQGYSADKATT